MNNVFYSFLSYWTSYLNPAIQLYMYYPSVAVGVPQQPFPSKKVSLGVLFMFQLTKVLMYMMVMHKTDDRTDQEGLPNPTQNTAQRFMI